MIAPNDTALVSTQAQINPYQPCLKAWLLNKRCSVARWQTSTAPITCEPREGGEVSWNHLLAREGSGHEENSNAAASLPSRRACTCRCGCAILRRNEPLKHRGHVTSGI